MVLIAITFSFENICFTGSANDVWQKFLVPMNNAIRDFVPLVSKKVYGKKKKNTKGKKCQRHIQRAMKKCDLWKVFKKKRSDENLKNSIVTKLLCVKS